MLSNKNLLLSLLMVMGFLSAPVLAQDVLVTPSQGEKSGSGFLGIFDRPTNKKADEKKDQEQKLNPQAAPAAQTQALPFAKATPAPVSKANIPTDPKKLQAFIKQNGAQQAAIAASQINGSLDKIRNQPTQVFEQPPQPKETVSTFPNSLTVKVGSMSFGKDELQRIAAGTGLSAADITRQCTQIIEGSVTNRAGTGGSFRFSGAGSARSGYDGELDNVAAALSFACRLSAPPVNKGMVVKNGNDYVLGVATTQCSPTNGRGSQVTISYAGDGKLSCVIE